jgi:hypothetical protein
MGGFRQRWTAVSLLLGIVLGLAVGGCHTMRFELIDAPSGPVVQERKSFFLWGLAPTLRVDMRTKYP